MKTNLYLPLNKHGRDFIICDLHGQLDMLKEKLDEINFDFEIDRMFSVGDLIDRGDDSVGCLKLVKEPWFYAVKGNHEEMMCDAYKETTRHPNASSLIRYDYTRNGGAWFYAEDSDSQFELQELANLLPLSITIGTKYGICHAQPPTNDWDDVKSPNTAMVYHMLWERSIIKYQHPFKNVFNIGETYHGHSYTKEPYSVGNMNFIDTGAVFGYELTCIEMK